MSWNRARQQGGFGPASDVAASPGEVRRRPEPFHAAVGLGAEGGDAGPEEPFAPVVVVGIRGPVDGGLVGARRHCPRARVPRVLGGGQRPVGHPTGVGPTTGPTEVMGEGQDVLAAGLAVPSFELGGDAEVEGGTLVVVGEVVQDMAGARLLEPEAVPGDGHQASGGRVAEDIVDGRAVHGGGIGGRALVAEERHRREHGDAVLALLLDPKQRLLVDVDRGDEAVA